MNKYTAIKWGGGLVALGSAFRVGYALVKGRPLPVGTAALSAGTGAASLWAAAAEAKEEDEGAQLSIGPDGISAGIDRDTVKDTIAGEGGVLDWVGNQVDKALGNYGGMMAPADHLHTQFPYRGNGLSGYNMFMGQGAMLKIPSPGGWRRLA